MLWLLIALLVLSPTIASLLQLALSRTREYDADLDAAGLTGDPRGLASALEKLERYQGGLFETLLLPGRRVPQPSLLRTHPPTRDRIARLLALEPEAAPRILGSMTSEALPARFRTVPGGPRWRATGLWY